jgi:hypothetical protein
METDFRWRSDFAGESLTSNIFLESLNVKGKNVRKQNILTKANWVAGCDLLPVSTGTIGIILLMIQFVNQAFLGHQFFQVQGRNRAFAVVRMNHYILSFSASIQIFSRKDNRLRYSFDIK